MKILIIGEIHFQPEMEIEKVEQIVRLEDGDDPGVIGELYLEQGYSSYMEVEANDNMRHFLPQSIKPPESDEEEQIRRDEKNGLYPGKEDIAN